CSGGLPVDERRAQLVSASPCCGSAVLHRHARAACRGGVRVERRRRLTISPLTQKDYSVLTCIARLTTKDTIDTKQIGSIPWCPVGESSVKVATAWCKPRELDALAAFMICEEHARLTLLLQGG